MPALRKQVALIINPGAGTGHYGDPTGLIHLPSIRAHCDIEVIRSTKAGDIINLARQHAESGKTILIAGGDGSVQEAAIGVKGSGTSLGILPYGSGNGLARHLHIQKKPVSALEQLIFNSRTEKVDMINLNERLFINVAGVGFDALVAKKFSLDGERGLKTYLKHIVLNFFSFPEFEFRLKSGDEEHAGKAWMITFANGSEFGNGARIAPQASLQDGLMDIVIIRKPKWYQLPKLIRNLMAGKEDNKMIRRLRLKNLSLSFDQPVDLHLDGEYSGTSSEISSNVIPQCVNLLVPENISRI